MAFRRGQLYWLAKDNGWWSIEAMPLQGGHPQVVAQAAPGKDPSPNVVFTEDSAVLTHGRGPVSAQPSSMGGGGGGGAAGQSSSSRAAPKPPGNGAIQTVPLAGGTPVPAKVNTLGKPPESVHGVVVGNALYWLSPGGSGFSAQTLMASPLDGGQPRAVASGLEARSLDSGPGMVFWVTPSASGGADQDLQYLMVSNGRRGTIHRFNSRDLPVATGEALYWIETGRSGAPESVMRTDVKDTHRTQVLSAAALGIRPVRLWAYNGGIYLLYTRSARRDEPGSDGTTPHRSTEYYLARIDESGPARLSGEEKLPHDIRPISSVLAGDGFYFFVSLPHGEDADASYGLFRVPLPH